MRPEVIVPPPSRTAEIARSSVLVAVVLATIISVVAVLGWVVIIALRNVSHPTAQQAIEETARWAREHGVVWMQGSDGSASSRANHAIWIEDGEGVVFDTTSSTRLDVCESRNAMPTVNCGNGIMWYDGCHWGCRALPSQPLTVTDISCYSDGTTWNCPHAR